MLAAKVVSKSPQEAAVEVVGVTQRLNRLSQA